jgi:menaquinone-dependent protoporphyrinogen IX oxidase
MPKTIITLIALSTMALRASSGIAATNVLVACQPSEFRTAVAKGLAERLQQAGCEVKCIDVPALAEESAGNYQAVVICDAVWAWRMNRHVRRFLARTDASLRARVIVLNTAGDADWRSKEPGIQAITAASVLTQVDRSVAQLLGRVKAVLAPAAPAPKKPL